MKLNGRLVVNVEIDGVDMRDYPDFCDAYFSYAEYADGIELSDDELIELTENHSFSLNELALESIY